MAKTIDLTKEQQIQKITDILRAWTCERISLVLQVVQAYEPSGGTKPTGRTGKSA